MNDLAENNDVIKEKSKVTPAMVKKAIAGEDSAPTFSKLQIIKSKKYALRQDALNVLLKEDGQYTHAQVDALLTQFYEGGKK